MGNIAPKKLFKYYYYTIISGAEILPTLTTGGILETQEINQSSTKLFAIKNIASTATVCNYLFSLFICVEEARKMHMKRKTKEAMDTAVNTLIFLNK